MTAYENDDILPEGCPRRPHDWNTMERGPLIADAWNDFLRGFGDSKLPDIFAVDPFNIYPKSLRTEPELKHFEKANAIQYHNLADYVRNTTFYEVEGFEEAVKGLEGMRKVLLEDCLTGLGCDCVVFPAAGDVGCTNADSSFEGAALAWRNGTYYGNGNRAMRHLGIPSMSVSMGIMSDKGVSVNLTLAGRAYDDVKLLEWANAFEAKTNHRVPPPSTPALDSDVIPLISESLSRAPRPKLTIEKFEAIPENDPAESSLRVNVQGLVTVPVPALSLSELDIMIDGAAIPMENIAVEKLSQTAADEVQFLFKAQAVTLKPIEERAGTNEGSRDSRHDNGCCVG